MGGTQFNGLALVHELVRQGHDVTIVNRGQTDAPLPEGINRLYADRTDHAFAAAELQRQRGRAAPDIEDADASSA